MFYLFDNINNYDNYDDMYNILNSMDKDKVDNYTNIRDKKLCMLSRKILRDILKDRYSINYNELDIKYNEYGKPYIRDIYFNISHSNDYVLVAISKRQIGVDIEKIRNVDETLINYICTDKEKNYVLGSDDINKSLFIIFCLKEAYYKMIGTGIANLKDIEFDINNISLNNNFNIILDNSIDGYVIAIMEEKD